MSIPVPEKDAIQETAEEGPARYVVFANRLRTAMTSGLRYSAYSSELGEAFRPLTKPIVVRSLYGISWLYVIGDTGYAGYKARELHRELTAREAAEKKDPTLKAKRLAEVAKEKAEALAAAAAAAATGKGKEKGGEAHHAQSSHHSIADPLEHSEATHVGLIVVRRAVFQSLASMALPAFTVHSTVHYSQPLFKLFENHKVRAIGPTILGLAVIPALPILFDEPVEHAVDYAFDYLEANVLFRNKGSNKDESSSSDLPIKPSTAAVGLPLAFMGWKGFGMWRRSGQANPSSSSSTLSTSHRQALQSRFMPTLLRSGGLTTAMALGVGAAVGAAAASVPRRRGAMELGTKLEQ